MQFGMISRPSEHLAQIMRSARRCRQDLRPPKAAFRDRQHFSCLMNDGTTVAVGRPES